MPNRQSPLSDPRLVHLIQALVSAHEDVVMYPVRISQLYNYLFLFDFLTARATGGEPPLGLTWAALSTGMVPLELHAEIHASAYRDRPEFQFVPALEDVYVRVPIGTRVPLLDWPPEAAILVDVLVGRRDRFPLEIWLRATPGEIIDAAEAHGKWMADDFDVAFPGLKRKEGD